MQCSLTLLGDMGVCAVLRCQQITYDSGQTAGYVYGNRRCERSRRTFRFSVVIKGDNDVSGALKNLARETTRKHGETESNFSLRRVRLLLEFVEQLEKSICNASDGTAAALPAASKVSITENVILLSEIGLLIFSCISSARAYLLPHK